MTQGKTYVFVYGTLKRGCPAEHIIRQAEGRFITTGFTQNKFRMMSTSSYPAIILDPRGHQVEGEIWEIPEWALDILDFYEGAPGFYIRKKIEILGNDGRIYKAWVYLVPEPRATVFPYTIKPDNRGLLVWKCKKS